MKGKITSGIKGPADGAFSTTETLYGKLSDSVTVKCKEKKVTKTVLSVFPSLLHTKEKHYFITWSAAKAQSYTSDCQYTQVYFT